MKRKCNFYEEYQYPADRCLAGYFRYVRMRIAELLLKKLARELPMKTPTLLVLCLLLNLVAGIQAGADEESDKANAKLVEQVANAEAEMFIMRGDARVTEIDRLLQIPPLFYNEIRSESNSLNQGTAFTDAMKQLIARPDLADLVNKHIKEVDPLSVGAGRLAIVLGKIGNRDSVPALIDLYQRAIEKVPDPGINDIGATIINQRRLQAAARCSWALWKLTGRKFAKRPDEWRKWWDSVSPYYETAAGRKADRKLPEDTGEIIKNLASDPETAREQLIAIGPAVVPVLQKQIADADSIVQYEMCWVMDELNQSAKLTPKLQRDYYVQRIANGLENHVMIAGLEDVQRRAFFQTELSDFCYVVMEVDRQTELLGLNVAMWSYVKLNSNDFRAKYGHVQGSVLVEHFAKQDVSKQVSAAVPELVRGLQDKSRAVRRCAAQVAGMIGFTTDENPPELIVALRDAWMNESDAFNLGEAGSALGRFDSPIVNQAFEKGLFSSDVRIVKASANQVDLRRFPLDDFPRVYERLGELTSHENSRVRFASVRSLVSTQPKRLVEHFERLENDEDADVREQVCLAIRELKNPMFQDHLVQMALRQPVNQADTNVRHAALQALADPAFGSACDDLLPLLDEQAIYGYALSTIVHAKGKKALPILFEMLQAGRDPSNLVKQYLPRLTGKNFETDDEWLEWWKKQSK